MEANDEGENINLDLVRISVPHPLKEELRRRKIKLWTLRNITHIPESKLSRYLNGIDPMPGKLEQLLSVTIKMIDKDDRLRSKLPTR